MYRIMGKYERCAKEEIDTAETHKIALYLLGEYQLAFGKGWQLWIKKGKRSC